MQIPYIRGKVAAQAHVGIPDGTVEEEFARNGFFGRYAHLYRTHAPVGWSRIEGPLRPRAYRASELGEAPVPGEYLAARMSMLENDDVRLHMARLDAPMPYYFRNADSDELLFVHQGAGRLETDFGPLAYEAGDYLLIPRGTTHRLHPTSATSLLVIESASEVAFPDKGMLGQHALFDPAVLRVPTPNEASSLTADARGEWEVRIQREGELTRVYYPYCPLDVVGWKGTLAPLQLNVRDIRPVSSDRYHLPPTAHCTFVAHNFVVCSFLPRPLENGDAAAMKVPFYHSNIDFDEVLFYHAGEFFSRQGITPGMLTFHPQGIHHGPQGGAAQRAAAATRTEEVAIMIDTKRPLRATKASAQVEIADYWQSWQK
ncbi:MAG: homogentisate 1,2-dioxygenase [Myxococcales bacterium]|nr:homogentisate 1,2-dioxygenase [Myxococcales bacterium]